MSDYVKKPCKHCPFRRDVTPFLNPERAEEIAYAPANRYNTFPCHKTTEFDDEGERVGGDHEKQCAGFLTLRAEQCDDLPEGFEPSFDLCYEDAWEMTEAYQAEWDRRHKRKEVQL